MNSVGFLFVVALVTISCCQANSYQYRIPYNNYYNYYINVCQRLDAPDNGRIRQRGVVAGSRAVYACDDGFTLNGNRVRVCQNDGTFSGEAPTCDIVDCGQPDPPVNGNVLAITTTVGSVVVFVCDDFFDEVGPQLATCQADGTYTNNGPICVPQSCRSLSSPDNGRVVTEPGRLVNSVATYSCRRGYSLIGNEQRTCQSNTLWSGEEPVCQRIRCPATLRSPRYGQLSYSGYYPGDYAIYQCSHGYEVYGGSHRRVCQDSGSWSGSDVRCRRRSSHYYRYGGH